MIWMLFSWRDKKDMVKFKDSAPRTTPGSRNITVEGVRIEGGKLVDESGDIVSALAD